MDGALTNDRQGTLVTDFNEFDVTLGRGKHANNRPGNIRFRQIAAELAGAYKVADSISRSRIAHKFIAKIHGKGGRFLQSVTAANSQGKVVTLWEVVSEEKILTKVKQALRDVGSERPTRRSAPSRPPVLELESPRQSSSEVTAPEEADCDSSKPPVLNAPLPGTATIPIGLPLPGPQSLEPPQEHLPHRVMPTGAQLQLLSQQRLFAQLQHEQQLQQLRAASMTVANAPASAHMMYAPQQAFPPPFIRRGDDLISLPMNDPRQQSNTNILPLLLQLQQQPQQARVLPHEQQQLSDLLLQQSLLQGDIHLPLIPAAPPQQLEPLRAEELFLGPSSRLQHEAEERLLEPDSTASLKRSASDADCASEHSSYDTTEDRSRMAPTTEQQQQQHRPAEWLLSESLLPEGLVMPSAVGLQQLPSASSLLPTAVAAPASPKLGELQRDSSSESITSSGATSLLATVVAARGQPGESWSDESDNNNKAHSSPEASKEDESTAAADGNSNSNSG